jgi:thiamine biosynthesis lipoprotein
MKRTFLFEAIQFRALGTEVLAVSPAANDLARAIRDTVEEHEERFSRFRPSSELERLSARAGTETSVSPEMFEVLSLAATFWCETRGIFDPLVRRALEAAGYDRSFERVPGASTVPAAAPPRRRPTFAAVQLDPETQSAHLPEGCALDLGGIAKGWIVDRLGALLAPYGPYLVDIGGDIAARGDGPDGGEGWLLSVADPAREGADHCWLRIAGQAVATSTTLRRRWQRAGRLQHHLIDPRTGRPSESDLVQATVIAPTAVQADIYAKTALILGREQGLDWLARRALPALLIGPGGAASTFDWQRFALEPKL